MKPKISISFYKTTSGTAPFLDWYESLDNSERAIIQARFDRIVDGNFGNIAVVAASLKELKFAQRSGYRIYYILEDGNRILLLNGGKKDSQERDIIKAKNYLAEYYERKSYEI